MISIVTKLLSIWVFIAQLFILAMLCYFLFFQKNKSFIKNNFGKVIDFLKKNAIMFAFFVALVAMMGSLFYSEIVGWSPCKLCWYQRILMYPLVLILWIAAMRRDNKIGVYVLPMTVIGAVIAAFHYLQQVSVTFAQLSKGCAADGVDCSVRYTFSYGYITIPMMALTAFIIIGLLAYLKRKER